MCSFKKLRARHGEQPSLWSADLRRSLARADQTHVPRWDLLLNGVGQVRLHLGFSQRGSLETPAGAGPTRRLSRDGRCGPHTCPWPAPE